MKNQPEKDIDALLGTESQIQVAKWVNELPELGPDMVWRSQLNGRLRSESLRRSFVRLGFGDQQSV
jgi:hypothetical protein